MLRAHERVHVKEDADSIGGGGGHLMVVVPVVPVVPMVPVVPVVPMVPVMPMVLVTCGSGGTRWL